MPYQPEIEYFGDFAAPCYATHGAAGFDLSANIKAPLTLGSLERQLIPTGVRAKLPHGHELQVRPRSGLALKHGIGIVNTPGTVDCDYYPGEVHVLLVNLSHEPYTVQPGERIAQAVVARFVIVAALHTETTQTRTGGHGSTGA